MIETLQTVILALVAAINSAQVEVRIETQALRSPSVITALENARKRDVAVRVVLGAKADFTLDSTGMPTGGNRPYDTGPQGAELRSLDAMQASVYIPPRFSEIDRPIFEPGVEMNAAFAVVDSKWAVLCTAPFNTSIGSDVCWRSNEQKFVTNLLALHRSDSEPSVDRTDEVLATTLASRDLVLTPDNSKDLIYLLSQRWTNVVVSRLGDGKALDALLQAPPGRLWLSPDGLYSRTALQKMKSAGWSVSKLQKPFAGVVLTSPRAIYMGAQKLDDLHISKSRSLGILLSSKYAAQVEQLLQIK